MHKIKFSMPVIEKLPFADNRTKLVEYSDIDTQYLILRITQTKKVFYYFRRLKGYKHPKKIKLGDFPKMTVAMSKRACERKTKELLEGKHVYSNKWTFKDLFYRYYNEHLSKHTKTHKEDLRYFKQYLEPLHGISISSITTEELTKLHTKLKKRKRTANKAIKLVRRTYNYGLKNNTISLPNPTDNIELFKEFPRKRYIKPGDEMKRFLKAVDEADITQTYKDFFHILLFTGARKSNVMSMNINDIDIEQGLWAVPGEISKNGEQLLLVLTKQVILIIKRRREENLNSDYIFPANSKTGYISDPKKAWSKLKKKSGLDDLRIHDLRRTYGSWQAREGASGLAISKSLGKKDIKSTTEVYTILENDPVRKSANMAVNSMLDELNNKDTEELSEVDKLKDIINSIDSSDKEEFKKKVLEEFFK